MDEMCLNCGQPLSAHSHETTPANACAIFTTNNPMLDTIQSLTAKLERAKGAFKAIKDRQILPLNQGGGRAVDPVVMSIARQALKDIEND